VGPVRGRAAVLDLAVEPGATRWLLVTYPPDFETAFHRTHTVDTDLIVEGAVTLILGDGEMDLRVGDMVIVNAVDHAWRTGPEGCRKAVHLLGIEPG
jgi:quercetin dioxygenase-like cupin family protein